MWPKGAKFRRFGSGEVSLEGVRFTARSAAWGDSCVWRDTWSKPALTADVRLKWAHGAA